MQTNITNSVAELTKWNLTTFILCSQSRLSTEILLFPIFIPSKRYHKHKGNSHLKDYLPEEQNPWEEKEKPILQTENEIVGEKKKPR